MNIEKLKQQADEEKAYQEKIQECQAKAISEFEKFFVIMENSDALWSQKVKKVVDRFVEDFKNYFRQNGFEVTAQNPFGQGGIVTEIEATYKELKFKLSEINYDGEHMYIQNFDNVHEEIWIALSNDVPNYFVWKDNIDMENHRLIDMSGSVKEKYKAFVQKFCSEEELDLLIRKIGINIAHFQEAVNHIDDTSLYIHRYGTDDIYSDFKELIEAIDD